MSLLFWRRYAVVCLVLFGGLLDVSAAATYIFGPRVFTRATGKPQVERVTFTASAPGTYVLHVEARDVSSAVVTLNGVTILSPDDFSGPRDHDGYFSGRDNDPRDRDDDGRGRDDRDYKERHGYRWHGNHYDHDHDDHDGDGHGHQHDAGCRVFDKRITLRAANVLTVELRSKPGSTLRLSIPGTNTPGDTQPPVITATAAPSPNPAGWNNGDVTVTFACTDVGSGIATCPSPVVVSADAANRVVSGEAVDKAGNRASASVVVNLDKTLPAIAARLSTPP